MHSNFCDHFSQNGRNNKFLVTRTMNSDCCLCSLCSQYLTLGQQSLSSSVLSLKTTKCNEYTVHYHVCRPNFCTVLILLTQSNRNNFLWQSTKAHAYWAWYKTEITHSFCYAAQPTMKQKVYEMHSSSTSNRLNESYMSFTLPVLNKHQAIL